MKGMIIAGLIGWLIIVCSYVSDYNLYLHELKIKIQNNETRPPQSISRVFPSLNCPETHPIQRNPRQSNAIS